MINANVTDTQMSPQEVYDVVYAIADPLITDFRKDLEVIDREVIVTDFPGVPFLHITRERGTHVVLFFGEERYPKEGEVVPFALGRWRDRKELLEWVCCRFKGYLDSYGGDIKTIIHYDGNSVRVVSPNQSGRRCGKKVPQGHGGETLRN